jgi:hopanoid biosynthesis associated protein HpnK
MAVEAEPAAEKVGRPVPSAPRKSESTCRLIINADDFGLSREVNAAVIRAHTEGVLTTASLMVNEEGFDNAVELARNHPRLGVGLHLSLVCGHSALPHRDIPNLVDEQRRFPACPVSAGFKFFFDPRCRQQLAREVSAQFEKFRATGLPLDHVNGHLHFHLHPAVFSIVMQNARRWNVRHVRLTHDPFWFNAKLARGRWGYRISHAAIFTALSLRARRALASAGIAHTRNVYGLLQHGLVDEPFLFGLLERLPVGDSELYSHPSLTQFKHELDALLSARVKAIIAARRIALIRYQDL